jgi:hypothetical protein
MGSSMATCSHLEALGFKSTPQGYELKDANFGIVVCMDHMGKLILTVHLWAQSSCMLDDASEVAIKIAACKYAIKNYVKELV